MQVMWWGKMWGCADDDATIVAIVIKSHNRTCLWRLQVRRMLMWMMIIMRMMLLGM
jgi:hypothetical protein